MRAHEEQSGAENRCSKAVLTPYHAKYFAHEISTKKASAVVDRLTTSLFDAAVDLNPHQIEAALFALRSPLSKGVMLADEVGLGKTIEAGILLCQLWAEHKRRLIVICPAVLRRQWSIELEEKFNLPTLVLESSNYAERSQNGDPFDFAGVVIISYQFANRYAEQMKAMPWHLVVIDEAHKLRNLFKKDNKMGRNIQAALADHKKVLLTATPLQNSLMELYGLASLIDDRIFGGIDTFKTAYVNGNPNIDDLKTRLAPFVQRTLRRQVLEYIRYTRREAITQPFRLSAEEQRLYDEVSDFLLQQDTYAIPWAQRKLVVLVIRKLLASSSYALVGTLKTIKARLEKMRETRKEEKLNLRGAFVVGQDIDIEYAEAAEDEEQSTPPPKHKDIDIEKLNYEIEQVEGFEALARSIKIETKATALLTALHTGFARMEALGAARKALVFTESSRTQRYLKEYLEANGYRGKVVTFNGQNADELSKDIYVLWQEKNATTGRMTGSKNVDMRMALVDFFRDHAEVMIATEAAAEGINLQFCSLIVNYDLPWNPQRIEQRIGRCHRYGQKHDVVVINFLNQDNLADQRIYELLKEKFQLFDGVFGASDEVLGRVESGIDFEKRILEIFETCRHPEEIEQAFAQLQAEMEEPIQNRIAETRNVLFEHFDEDVTKHLKFSMEATKKRIDTVTHHFWELTKYVYQDTFFFNDEKLIFGDDPDFIRQGERPAEGDRTPIYHYLETKAAEPVDPLSRPKRELHKVPVTGYPYRLSDLMGERVIQKGREIETPPATLLFDLSCYPHKIALLEEQRGKRGWLWCDKLTIKTFEETESLIFTVCDESGAILPPEFGEKLLLLSASNAGDFPPCPHDAACESARAERMALLLSESEASNHHYFEEELDKLDRWAEDLKTGLEIELKQLDRDIREADRQSKQLISLAEKLAFQSKKPP